MPLFEYACLLHPQSKSADLAANCPECGLSFDWCLKNPPAAVNGNAVERPLGRGFYGSVYQTTHPRTGRRMAVKIVPQKVYAPLEQGGLGRETSFEEEARLHADLSDLDLIAGLIDYGEEELLLGGETIPCWWLEMEFIEGRRLADIIREGPQSPREVAQIAMELLAFVELMRQRDKHHNDLHHENVMVVELPEHLARRSAIDPYTTIRILDLGAAAERSKSGPERLGDIHWVAVHISRLLDAYERANLEPDPSTQRLVAQLRLTAEYYSGVDEARRPSPTDMQAAIRQAYAYGTRPGAESVRLSWVGEHYNAQSLPSSFASELLVDAGSWLDRLAAHGPTLLAGMRGCGKTILLRALEWTARLHPRPGESGAAVVDRVASDPYLGLFVSCATLLRGPRSKPPDVPVHRLFLAYAREIVRDVQACELAQVGEVNYPALQPFCDLVKQVIPWFDPPDGFVDPVAVARALQQALNDAETGEINADINTSTAFEALASVARPLVDIWENKYLLFLLDDVSTRYLLKDNISDLLSQFSLQNQYFGFKVSTENQTLALMTPGGEYSRRFRDYDFFDLGEEVLHHCEPGDPFIENVLAQRVARTDGETQTTPSDTLGSRSLQAIAEAIRDDPNAKVYWGIDALAGMCVGDIGDILRIYGAMLERGRQKGFPVPPDEQHDAAEELATKRLIGLAGRHELLWRHAVSFAEASHAELRASTSRVRQYTQLHLNVDPAQANDVFEEMIKLVDAGVFVLRNITTRAKKDTDSPRLQFRLSYSPILGLPTRIPLSKRDRFELPSRAVADWLADPTPGKLRRSRTTGDAASGESSTSRSPGTNRRGGHGTAAPSGPDRSRRSGRKEFDLTAQQAFTVVGPPRAIATRPRLLYEVETAFSDPVEKADVAWASTTVIGALGFEERSLGAWKNLLPHGSPGAVHMVRYDNPGLAKEIEAELAQNGLAVRSLSSEELVGRGAVGAYIRSIDGPLAIDLTSLTKSLIYRLVRHALLERGEVLVLHTDATTYFPPDETLLEIIEFARAGNHLEVFKRLDESVVGEIGPYETVEVVPPRRDPSQPSFMAVVAALKFERVRGLLEDIPVERIAAIAPVSFNDPEGTRSSVGAYLADYLAQSFEGTVHQVGSLDHDATYRTLVDLHREHALNGAYNFEVGLTGSKMHTLGAAMMGAVATPAAVHYSQPAEFNSEEFTKGTGGTQVIHLRRVEKPSSSQAS